ncbi:MAG: type II toxin-antitoxin system HicB family antitoxin [Candidatus Berkelbacteria bacterium]|nr:type II toxin-antitoxin system HicB family antitoxin [Candidatus Berkelbacteria bacterium]MCR4307432.1 type II toxin-antitoxin system HicB family antitoxin [Candidatus Berkelbacteria bacterium]
MSRKATRRLRYRAIFRPEPEGGFTVTVPSLPGCITYGENLSEAKIMGREAIELYLEDLASRNETLPNDNDAYMTDIEVASPDEVLAHA